jgi:hypothetical protein
MTCFDLILETLFDDEHDHEIIQLLDFQILKIFFDE